MVHSHCVTRSLNVIFCLRCPVAVHYSNGDLNSGPFDDPTVFDHLNTGRVCYSDPHCIMSSNMIHQKKKGKKEIAATNFINQLGHF